MKGLDALEEINKVIPYAHITEEYKTIEKELKALEVIRNKNVDTSDLFVVFEWFGRGEEELALNSYNSRHKTDEEYNDITLTLEELKLLQEVL